MYYYKVIQHLKYITLNQINCSHDIAKTYHFLPCHQIQLFPKYFN